MNRSTSAVAARKTQAPAWHAPFLRMLPQIQESASFAFRHFTPEAREDALQEVTASALAAFVRLFELGKAALAYPTVLARYGVVQYRSGRRVGSRLNVRDVLSPYAQRRKNFHVGHLHRFNCKKGEWQEVLVEDKRATPADVAAIRIDFEEWLKSLNNRQRRFVDVLSAGESTTAAARKFKVSLGRISQIRQELKQSWQAFQGEATTPSSANRANPRS